MVKEREKGITYSVLMHFFIILLMIFGLPSFLWPQLPAEPQAITVELLPVTGVTNVKPSEKAAEPQEKPEEKKPDAKPTPPVKTAEPPPPPPPPKPVEKPKEKVEEKKPEPPKKEEKPKPKAKEEDLDAVLKAVKDTAQKKEAETKAKDAGEKSKSHSESFDPTQPLSMSEKDAIRSQIAKCWNVPAGAKDAQELVVVLDIELERDGSVLKVELANESKARYSRDSFFRAAADSAIRAVRQCSPLKDLPVDKYQTWRSLELGFDPKEMLF